jgi:hypothetical protein
MKFYNNKYNKNENLFSNIEDKYKDTNSSLELFFEAIMEFKDLKEIISVLMESKNDNKIDDSTEESDEEEDSDNEENQEIVEIPTKGGKKIPAVVQMKNGRQVVRKENK